MRNIPKKRSPLWGIVILILALNIVIIKAAYDNPVFLWLLVFATAILTIAVYSAWQGNRSLLSFIKSPKSFAQRPQYELLPHSIYPAKITNDDLQVLIGNDQCSNPYNACLLSVEAWENINYSWFAHPELHGKEFEAPGDIKLSFPNTFNLSAARPVWQVDATYQGCRTENGNFDSLAFKRIAGMPDVKMIEINLNSSVDHDYWVDSVLAKTKLVGVKGKTDLFTRPGYTTFRDAEGLVHFIESLRSLSSGKPVGIRLSINDKQDFHKICHAIRKTQIIPDFIVVTGSSGKTAFNHPDLVFYSGMPLYEALLFVSQTLQVYRLDKDIKVIAAGEVVSGFDILKLIAMGANSVCVDSTCINTTERSDRQDIKFPSRNSNIHYRLMRELVEIMDIGGFRSIKDVTLSKFLRRLDAFHSKRYTQTEEQVLFRGSVKKMFYDKTNKIESENKKSQEQASLQ